MADYQSILLKLNNSSNTLREREARYAGNAPVDLLNQITDYEQAISLTQQVLASDLSEAEWNQSLRSLNIDQTLIEGGFFQKIFQTLSIPSEGQRDLRNRQIMLQRVRDFWIEGVLEISLHNEVLIDLKMESKPEAVDNPWDTVIQQPEQPDHVLSSESKITDVFDESGGSLLILGEPGSGKTTILLDLGRQLIARAQTDLSQPIPVVFNLSSWVGQRLPLSEWLVEELNTKYSIPKKLAQRWIDDDALLLLLDGLDEVTQQHRTACVEAINSFNQDSLTSIVVCSRIRAYEAVGVRLNLRQAIVLQPLSQQQIETYLQPNVGSSNLVALLQEEPDLQAFMNTPLILNIIALTGQDTDTQAMVKQDSAETHLKQLFQAYVSEMFKRRGSSARYDENQTAVWLTWLAKKMTQFNQTIFLIESLQPSTSRHK